LQKRSELEQVIADSIKSITQANTDASVALITAQAQAKANQIIARSLTPTLVQYEQIQKWNGVLPSTNVSSGNSGLLLNIK